MNFDLLESCILLYHRRSLAGDIHIKLVAIRSRLYTAFVPNDDLALGVASRTGVVHHSGDHRAGS
jgi:hypothetical protein